MLLKIKENKRVVDRKENDKGVWFINYLRLFF